MLVHDVLDFLPYSQMVMLILLANVVDMMDRLMRRGGRLGRGDA